MRLYTPGGRRSILQALVFGAATLRLITTQYDVVDCCAFPYFSTFAARIAVAARGGTLVSTWHEFWGADYWRAYLGPLGSVGERVERAAARMSCRIIAVSSATASGVRQANRAAVVTILPNGVDSRALRDVLPDGRRCDVIYAGRLCDYKDVELLLASVALLAKRSPLLTCRIVGDGPHRSFLERL
jgi:glycosyltransferase involved in cell wall biosynthesis